MPKWVLIVILGVFLFVVTQQHEDAQAQASATATCTPPVTVGVHTRLNEDGYIFTLKSGETWSLKILTPEGAPYAEYALPAILHTQIFNRNALQIDFEPFALDFVLFVGESGKGSGSGLYRYRLGAVDAELLDADGRSCRDGQNWARYTSPLGISRFGHSQRVLYCTALQPPQRRRGALPPPTGLRIYDLETNTITAIGDFLAHDVRSPWFDLVAGADEDIYIVPFHPDDLRLQPNVQLVPIDSSLPTWEIWRSQVNVFRFDTESHQWSYQAVPFSTLPGTSPSGFRDVRLLGVDSQGSLYLGNQHQPVRFSAKGELMWSLEVSTLSVGTAPFFRLRSEDTLVSLSKGQDADIRQLSLCHVHPPS